MLHIMQSAQPAALSNPVLRNMYAARKSVFVDLLKWDVPVNDDLYEVDQFDTGEAIYLILTDETNGHLGSARLLPTMTPHILDSLYPELCAVSPPRDRTIFEITRFCLDRRLFATDRKKVRDTLIGAIANYALDNGVTAYSAIADQNWAEQILSFGWRCKPLGSPQCYGSTKLIALRIDVTPDILERLQKAGISPATGFLCTHNPHSDQIS